MKHLFLCLFICCSFFVTAQTPFGTGSQPTAPAKPVRISKPVIDSATIYYNLGWDYYKMDSMGPARYYWDMATYVKGSITSKYAAYNRLGLMHQNGEGVAADMNTALYYYKKAAGVPGRFGNPDALKALGGFYENGFGVEQSDKLALAFYLKAKQAGNEYVADDIKRIQDRIRNK